jgi:hypothetical protein
MVYQIITYDLIDKKFYTCQEMPELEMRLDQPNGRERFYYKGTNNKYPESHLWDLSTFPKKGAINPEVEQMMPYMADVTEDLPGSATKIGVKPKTWKGCQLMVEKHGGYLQFLHQPTGEVLRIAMNSNYYTPI